MPSIINVLHNEFLLLKSVFCTMYINIKIELGVVSYMFMNKHQVTLGDTSEIYLKLYLQVRTFVNECVYCVTTQQHVCTINFEISHFT